MVTQKKKLLNPAPEVSKTEGLNQCTLRLNAPTTVCKFINSGIELKLPRWQKKMAEDKRPLTLSQVNGIW